MFSGLSCSREHSHCLSPEDMVYDRDSYQIYDCKYFPLFCSGYLLTFLKMSFHVQKLSISMKTSLSLSFFFFSFIAHAFGIISRNPRS